jgi:NAD(P)-dependent dehydrogenase (short-subunit alcohol dehydrogenase family)
MRSGRIINISSIAGSVGTQGRTAYSASKFALTGVSECLAAEVSPFGIHVTVVEPGAFRTGFFDNSKTEIHAGHPDYVELADKLNDQFRRTNGNQGGDPELAARALITLAESAKPPVKVPLGPDAVKMLAERLCLMNVELQEWREWAAATSFRKV